MKRLFLVALFVTALDSPAGAPTPSPRPPVAPSVVAPPVVIRLEGKSTEARVPLVIGNDGPASDAVKIWLIDAETGKHLQISHDDGVTFSDHVTVTLDAYQPTPINLRVKTGTRPVHGQVIVQPKEAKAAFAAFKTERRPSGWAWFGSILFSVLVAIPFVIGAWRALGDTRAGLSAELPVDDGKKWSFSESWAANVSAVAGLLGTALAATGFVGDVLEGVSVSSFVGMNLLYGAMALTAPLAYRIFSRRSVGAGVNEVAGTVRGFLYGATVALTAAIGQLSVLIVMATMSSSGAVGAIGVVVSALLIGALCAYAARTVQAATRRQTAVAPSDEQDEAVRRAAATAEVAVGLKAALI